MPIPCASQALSRFTVLDLTRVRSGPTCVRHLADWGADVIKIDALMEDAGGEQPGGPRRGSDFRICTADFDGRSPIVQLLPRRFGVKLGQREDGLL
jgi:CoA-transferase family III